MKSAPGRSPGANTSTLRGGSVSDAGDIDGTLTGGRDLTGSADPASAFAASVAALTTAPFKKFRRSTASLLIFDAIS